MGPRRSLFFVSISWLPTGAVLFSLLLSAISWWGSVCLLHVEGGETCQDHRLCFTWHRLVLKRDSPIQAKFPTRGAFYWPSVARVHLLHSDPLGCGTVVRAETSLRGWLHCWPHEWWQVGGRPRRRRRHLVGISFPASVVACPDPVMHGVSQSLGKKPTGGPPLTSRWKILSYWRKRKRFDRNQDWESRLKSLAQCSVFWVRTSLGFQWIQESSSQRRNMKY